MEQEKFHRYKELCRQLLRQGIKPTPTEFARRGWGYVVGGNVPRRSYKLVLIDGHYHAKYEPFIRTPVPIPGSGVTWSSGRYTQARREVLQEFGWTYQPNLDWRGREKGTGTWLAPKR